MFYKSISENYDYIFPQNPMQLSLIEKDCPIKEGDVILDIGCATGSLTQLISTRTSQVIGLDLDSSLLTLAKKKYPHISFVEKDMLTIDSFGYNHFDRIVSFGNTLVHLPSRSHVKDFFYKAYQALKVGGQFTVQIINYNRIYDQNIQGLPLIDNDHIRFERDYVLKEDKVSFDTRLFIKKDQTSLSNSIELLNLRQNELKEYLEAAGFKNIEFYGDLKGQALSSTSIPLIFTCYK